MKYEDLTTEIYFLNKGVEKLQKYNIEVFEMYADEVGLSYCDRNRVIAKCRLIFKRPDLKEQPCPKELLSDRWNYYTKKMGYSDQKAREVLAVIDEFYKSQFLPPNYNRVVEQVAKGNDAT